MRLYAKCFAIIKGQKPQWSGKLFLIFFGVYFLLILFLALPDGRSTLLGPEVSNPACVPSTSGAINNCAPLRLTPRSTVNDYLKIWGDGDPGSYARGGLLLAGKEWGGSPNTMGLSFLQRLKLMNLIGFGMWPPGMFILNALPIMLSEDVSLGLYQIVISTIIWAVAFALIASLLILYVRLWLALILPALLLTFPLFHDYFIRYGVMYSETYCVAFMVIAFSLLAINYKRVNNNLMLGSGICFAIASFFRGQMLPVSVGVSLILLLVYLKKIYDLKSKSKIVSKPLTLATLTFFIGFYLPIEMYMSFNRGALFHASYVYEIPFSIPAFSDAGVSNF